MQPPSPPDTASCERLAGAIESVTFHSEQSGRPDRLRGGTDESSDFYLIEATDPEDIAAKLYATVTTRIPHSFGFDPVEDIQALAPMNRGGLGVQAINVELQRLLNRTAEPQVQKFGTTDAPGDKVLQRVNNYYKKIFNGTSGGSRPSIRSRAR